MECSAEIAALLLRHEQSLLDPAVRRDRERVLALLASDFAEFGASGRVWTRDEIVHLLATETYDPPTMEAFKCRSIAAGVALVTYRTVRTDAGTGFRRIVNRSSIWIENDERWQICFHQGTPANQAAE